MKKILGLILLASLTACGGGSGGGATTSGSSGSTGSTGSGGTAVSTKAPERAVIKLSVGDVQKLSSVAFSSATVIGFEAPSQSK